MITPEGQETAKENGRSGTAIRVKEDSEAVGDRLFAKAGLGKSIIGESKKWS